MSNLTLMIEKCRIIKFYKSPNKSYAAGKILWTDGTIEFEKSFSVFSDKIIAVLETYQPEGEFRVFGSLTKKPGAKGSQWEDKMFEEIIITKVEVHQKESIEDDKIPF